MKLREFIDYLEQSTAKNLIFSVNGLTIPLDYHITEIKDANFKTVDCGGKKDQWRETIIQLWNTQNTSKKKNAMKVEKGLSIVNKVNEIQPLNFEGTLKFEYRKSITETTAIYSITEIQLVENDLIVQLGNIPTQCKAAATPQKGCSNTMGCC
jgi:hypothetical protein